MPYYLIGTEPDPNTPVTPNIEAVAFLCDYPLASQRKDYNQSEWTMYKIEWDIFNKIWTYNYSVSTINGLAQQKVYEPYKFLSYDQRVAYIKGQQAHVAYYVTYLGTAPVGSFNDIVQGY